MKVLLVFLISVLAACADETKFGVRPLSGGAVNGDEKIELVPAAAACESSDACPSYQHCLDLICVDISKTNLCDDERACSGGDHCDSDGICR